MNTKAQIGQLLTMLLGASEVQSYVAGGLMRGDGDVLTLTDPATGQRIADFPDAGQAVVDTAAEAAQVAQREWAAKTASERGRIMFEIARQIRAHADPLARLEAMSAGRPSRDAAGEPARMAEMFEYYAGWSDKITGDVIPVPTSHLNYTRHEPIGVVTQ
ncbi:MAG: aldehyde dehydrogenase family protein, partial [Paracoccus sp. (in: a-proteobacteria)]|nr:aldehyde dehydrogenase family protein [Paracoccus sp. (in: a-proteobacteria)]